jgi:hypothetical protein
MLGRCFSNVYDLKNNITLRLKISLHYNIDGSKLTTSSFFEPVFLKRK